MKSNLNKINNEDFSELTDHNIGIKPKYGEVIIKETPKDSIIIINGDNVEIIKKDKYMCVDNDLHIEVKGNITILQKDTDIDNIEGLVSFSKLKALLEVALGNYGATIQYPIPLLEENLTYENIKIGKE